MQLVWTESGVNNLEKFSADRQIKKQITKQMNKQTRQKQTRNERDKMPDGQKSH